MIHPAPIESTVPPGIDRPRVSVIVPAFNAEASLGACLDSLQNQSMRPLEIIVVDDASTDTSAWLATERGALVIRMLANGGPGLARNAGAAAASGDILPSSTPTA